MNKLEFLNRLEAGLATLPAEERVAALQYYTEYLDDAGPENEAGVMQEIGTPEQLAADIRAESGAPEPAAPPRPPMPSEGPLYVGEAPQAPEPPALPADANSEAFQQGQQAAQNMLRRTSFAGGQGGSYYAPDPNGGYPGTYPPPGPPSSGYQNPDQSTLNTLLRAGLIVVAVLCAPAVFGFAVALFVMCLVPYILSIAFVFAGVVMGFSSLTLIQVTLGNALLVMGMGVFLFGLGLLALMGANWLMRRALPAMFRGVGTVWRAIWNLGRNEVQHG